MNVPIKQERLTCFLLPEARLDTRFDAVGNNYIFLRFFLGQV